MTYQRGAIFLWISSFLGGQRPNKLLAVPFDSLVLIGVGLKALVVEHTEGQIYQLDNETFV